MRTTATSQFEKDLFTLMNNSAFGNTQENLGNRADYNRRARGTQTSM